MIKTIITNRVNKLLAEIEEIADRVSQNLVDAQNELSLIKKASLSSIQPKDLKRIFSIQQQLQVLGAIFNKADK